MESNRLFAPALLTAIAASCALLVFTSVCARPSDAGQAPPSASTDPPLTETRLPVHNLLREDIFAGFLANDMKRFARGEKNIDRLMELRPTQKANLLAWKGGATMFRAVLAHEGHHADEFKTKYKLALDQLSEAAKLKTGNDGVAAITGGSFSFFADRLPKENQAAAWAQAYDAYQTLWKAQSSVIASLPEHFKGEVLSGLAKTAERTGRKEEAAQYLDKMITMLHDTPYEAAAKEWKSNPASTTSTQINCLGCHEAGRLAARIAKLETN